MELERHVGNGSLHWIRGLFCKQPDFRSGCSVTVGVCGAAYAAGEKSAGKYLKDQGGVCSGS